MAQSKFINRTAPGQVKAYVLQAYTDGTFANQLSVNAASNSHEPHSQHVAINKILTQSAITPRR